MSSLAKYSFIPWLKQGIANKIIEQDNLGAPIAQGSSMAKERPELTVKLKLNTIEVRKKLKLHGPGDIMGINNDAVLKVHPKSGTQDFESNALAYIEFYEEDFLWRYTPAIRVDNEKRLRPWLFLIVVKEGEYEFRDNGNGLPYVSIKSEFAQKVFPSHRETWAWAHVHVNHSLGEANLKTNLSNELTSNPDVAYSRLICPRRLERSEEGVKYHAFLIPTFETGRLAGLGEDPKDIFAQQASWTTGGSADSSIRPNDFPVYYNWEFKTGQYGDFETLVKILKAQPLGPGFGKREMNIEMPGMGLNGIANSDVLGFEGALKPPSFTRTNWPNGSGDTQFRNKLKSILNISQDIQEESGSNPTNPYYDSSDPNVFYSEDVVDDPIVTPPIYGKWHALVKKVREFDGNLKEWVVDLNLDPRNRAAASIGTQTIRKHQEKFMEMAWQQIGEVNEANQKIREGELEIMVNNSIYEKHYSKLDENKLLMVTAAAQKQIIDPDNNKTFETNLTASKIPNAARSAAFRKVIRPGKKNIRKMNDMGDENTIKVPIQKSLMTNFNLADSPDTENALTAAKKKIIPSMAITTSEVETAINFFLNLQNTPEAQDNENLQLPPEAVSSQTIFLNDFTTFSNSISNLQILQTGPPISNLVNFSQTLFSQLNPMTTIKNLIMPLIMTGNNQIEKVKPIMEYPEIPDPMFEYLQNLSQDFIIPNIREIPENTITLLENNQVFIESFMAGLNHEMSKELLWREYPTDQRGSYFRNFWDDKDSLSVSSDHDILAMDSWKGNLGIHNERIIKEDGTTERKKNFVVLVIRGDLLKKYPNTVIYAQKAVSQGSNQPRTLSDSGNLSNIRTPIFQAELEPDIAMFGFNITKEEARGNNEFPAGWFFVLKERPGEINFGLDDSETIPSQSAQQWNDLEWGHLVPADGSLNNLNHIHCNSIRSTASAPNWGTNSAEMAYILYQMPVIFARHAEEMLP